ncbi:hypothetical protein D3C73_1327510 [compost metagenome]
MAFGRNSDHQGKIRDVFGDDSTSSHCCPPSNGDWCDADSAGTDGCSFTNGDTNGLPVVGALQAAIRANRPGVSIVCKYNGRADEDACLQYRGLVDKCIVLNFAVVPHFDSGANIGAASYDAVDAQFGLLADLGKMPNL